MTRCFLSQIKGYSQPDVQQHEPSQQAKIRRLKAELRRLFSARLYAVASPF